MTRKTLKGTAGGHGIHLVWGGDVFTRRHEVLVSTREDINSGNYVDGPALRDALLEAFPLEAEKPIKQYGSVVKPAPTPGIVWRNPTFGHTYITLPGDKVFVLNAGFHNRGDIINYDFGIPANATVIFDPRDAVALPSPLGIRVGDTVRKVSHEGYDDGPGGMRRETVRTTEFEVNHIDGDTGYICAKYGPGYNPKGFEVTSREVPDRLPAGTITRNVQLGNEHMVLRTTDGYIRLSDGAVEREDTLIETLVRSGKHEVIHLPES